MSSSPRNLSNYAEGGGSSSGGSGGLEAKLRLEEAGGGAGEASGAVDGDRRCLERADG